MSKMPLQVLIVEDDIDYNAIMHELLLEEIEHVDTAFNGSEGLKFIREKAYDCVISDVQMPVMDGLNMIKTIRAEGYSFPIILMTGQSHATRESALSIGATALLAKPLDFTELLNSINSVVKNTRK